MSTIAKSASFLNNDGIDQLVPVTRRTRVSSLSLSDQWGSRSQLNMALAHQRLTPKEIIDHKRIANYAFAFDIDGVIVKGPQTIPEAVAALKMLNGENKYNITVPYIFVTNGGGRSEQARCAELSRRLGIEVKEKQVIQGHTPMKDLINVHKNVLVVGGIGDICKQVAVGYGFQNVYTPIDIMKWHPAVSPYHNLTEDELKIATAHDFSKIAIDGILVFADSRNWAADLQIILDLLLSVNGVMGTVSETFDQGPPIYFAHSDFVWATDFPVARLGMGALQVSIAAIYQERTGKILKPVRFGKPQRGTFKYAEKVLKNFRKSVLEDEEKGSESDASAIKDISSEDEEDAVQSGNHQVSFLNLRSMNLDSRLKNMTLQHGEMPPASTVYFVGDTPESDIRFANSHDSSWHSILVKTGVYQDGTEPKYKPKHTCANVLEAVQYAIEREHALELKEWNEKCAAHSVIAEIGTGLSNAPVPPRGAAQQSKPATFFSMGGDGEDEEDDDDD